MISDLIRSNCPVHYQLSQPHHLRQWRWDRFPECAARGRCSGRFERPASMLGEGMWRHVCCRVPVRMQFRLHRMLVSQTQIMAFRSSEMEFTKFWF
ncbi:hypothetical protein Mapa_002748 [Marchantia paleacea]|nr:hypothetical protein Mapa_002748 [Marchantia paleacea]